MQSFSRGAHLVWLVLLLIGCGTSLPNPAYFLNNQDDVVIDQLIFAWEEQKGLPSVGELCHDTRRSLRVAPVAGESFHDQCADYCEPGNCPGYRTSRSCRFGCAQSCFTHYCYRAFPGCTIARREIPVIAIHESFFDPHNLEPFLIHEGLHWLEWCTGNGIDHTHQDSLVWGPQGLRAQMGRE